MKKYLIGIVIIIISFAAWLIFLSPHATAPEVKPASQHKNRSQTTNVPKPKSTAGFDRATHSTTDAASIWVIVNKSHPLSPKTYVPSDLVVPDIPLRSNITTNEKYVSDVMAPALKAMVDAAREAGLTLNLQSGYRSYQFQVALYNNYVNTDGQAKADTYSARPGYSEHQTGLAADLGGTSNPSCNVDQCFGQTIEGKWLAANAYKFGFVIRYPNGYDNITGYEYEPWHVRYIGISAATAMHDQDIKTLEQFFGISGGTNYK